MAKRPTHHGKTWTGAQNQTLRKLASQNTPTRVIGIKMGRTPAAIQSQASSTGISLKPTNQSPYNRRAK